VQFKIEPMNVAVKKLIGKDEHIRIIGYDYDEIRRSEDSKGKEDSNQTSWFPLIEWEMGRDECIKTIQDAGLPLAGKSSCFFCPNMRKHEIKKLAIDHPDLIAKAILMEDLAEQRRLEEGRYDNPVQGLGRTWKWKNLIAVDDMFGFNEPTTELPCGCYDGESE
jgi:hypothetical protein